MRGRSFVKMAPDESDLTRFVYESISDMQATIRSTDVKIGFQFLILCSPIPIADKILPAVQTVWSNRAQLGWWPEVDLLVAIVTWVLALWALSMSVAGISNPANKIVGEGTKGTFFGAGLFQFGIIDAFFGFRNKSERTVQEELTHLQQAKDNLLMELVFDRMKLIYIRDIKLRRYRTGLFLTAIWGITSIIFFVTKTAG